MRRRSILYTILILTTVFFAVGGTLIIFLKQEPEFYTTSDENSAGSDWERSEYASALLTHVQDLKNDIRSKAEWGATFHDTDLNCFFQENFNQNQGLASILPKNFHSPRVVIDGDRVKLGMRYRSGFWSTVISLEIRAWLPMNDTNVIALEFCSLKAGGLSIGCQSLLDSLSEAAHDSNVDVTWYRHDKHPVGMFRFYADQLRPTTQIHTFKVVDGSITLAGRTRLEGSIADGPAPNPLGLTD